MNYPQLLTLTLMSIPERKASPHPIDEPCFHVATLAEQQRDPNYLFCEALPGERCRWARRYDGVVDPDFHGERLEAAFAPSPADQPLTGAAFDHLINCTGLV